MQQHQQPSQRSLHHHHHHHYHHHHQQQQQLQYQSQQQQPHQHHSRRRKKRVNYGSRTVEIVRGNKGFGFTISGQQPCILSCIVQGSPADVAGLRSGDYLVAVNGHGVNKAPHDDVVKLIGKSNGLLRLQIADHYYSDSSDEDDEASIKTRSRPRYRSRSSNASGSSGLSATLNPQCRVAKVVRDLQSGAMFDANATRISVPTNLHRWNRTSPLPPPPRKRDSEKIVHRAVLGYLGTIDIPSHLQSVSMMSLVRKCIKRIKAEKRNPTTVLLTIHVANIKLVNMEGRIIAQYPSNRIVYCNSFSSEDKQHFGILTRSISNGADNNNDINHYENEVISNSCHVFKIHSKITDHTVHASTSSIFNFSCTKANELNNACQEFPASCDGLLGAIQTLYIADKAESETNLFDNRRNRREAQTSPQPSNVSTSTAHSSNSDSGIGFKDDCGCHSDRNVNAELPPRYNERSIVVSSLGRNIKDPSGSRLTVRAISDPRWSDFPRPFGTSSCYSEKLHNSEADGNGNSSNHNTSGSPRNSDLEPEDYSEDYPEARILAQCKQLKKSRRSYASTRHSSGGEGSIVSCPAVPSGRFAMSTSPAALAALARSPRYTSALAVGTLHQRNTGAATAAVRTIRDLSKSNGNFSGMQIDLDVPARLSPKVYPNGMKIQGYSMENLKTSPGSKSQTDYCSASKSLTYSHHADKANEKIPRAWGSLQEMRVIAGCEYDDCVHGSNESCDKPSSNGVHTWAISLEKLLEDPNGLKTFAKFLKKEISHENIYFWAACKQYADTQDLEARKQLAAQIYQRHLSNNASEPVNVDSETASQITPESLEAASIDLFEQSQKKILQLMRFDSYARFIKSDMYKKCLESGYDDEDSSPEDGDLLFANSTSSKLKKSRSDAEDRCRKSILSWPKKNRSKSKDRGELEYNKTPSRNEKRYQSLVMPSRDNDGNNEDDTASISSSRSSLASWDQLNAFAKTSVSSCEGQSSEKPETHMSNCTGLCRVILPDGSTTVIPTNHTDSVRDVVTRLFDKRALRYSNYDVLMLATDEIVNLKYPSSVLSRQEVEIVPAKVIKIDLPSRRVISVVAHKGKTLKEVLKPLLNKHGFKLDLVTIWADGHPVSVDIIAANAPARLSLTSNKKEIVDDASLFKRPDVPKGQPTLEEVTNKVFEELLVGKSNSNKNDGDAGSCKSDDQKSETSSTRSSKFFSRDSTFYIKKKSKSRSSNMSEKSSSDCGHDDSHRPHPPLIAKLRNGVKLQLPSRFEKDDLYEGIKRLQRTRLDDQRGIEINSELPDFLKNKENEKMLDEKKRRKSRPTSGNYEFSKFYDSEEERPFAERCFDNSSSLDATVIDIDKTITENGNQKFNNSKISNHDNSQISPTKLSKPPPLPPKPKSLSNTLRSNVLPSRPFQRVVNYDKKTI